MSRETILRYKLAARAYRQGKQPYGHVEAARSLMVDALGYGWVYGYLGEFCNLHERDFPNMIRSLPSWPDGTYRHHGFMWPVDAATHRKMMREARQRALWLSRMFCMPTAHRFLAGFHVAYKGGAAAIHAGRFLRFDQRNFSCSLVESRPADTSLDLAFFNSTSAGEFWWQELMPWDLDQAESFREAAQ